MPSYQSRVGNLVNVLSTKMHKTGRQSTKHETAVATVFCVSVYWFQGLARGTATPCDNYIEFVEWGGQTWHMFNFCYTSDTQSLHLHIVLFIPFSMGTIISTRLIRLCSSRIYRHITVTHMTFEFSERLTIGIPQFVLSTFHNFDVSYIASKKMLRAAH